MFEYTALVDAPVKRFTSIVTDPEPDEAPIVAAVVATPSIAMPVVETPILVVPKEVVEAVAKPVVATPFERPPRSTPMPQRRTYMPPEPTSKPSIVPALIGIAAAGVTAFWWIRRDSHVSEG